MELNRIMMNAENKLITTQVRGDLTKILKAVNVEYFNLADSGVLDKHPLSLAALSLTNAIITSYRHFSNSKIEAQNTVIDLTLANYYYVFDRESFKNGTLTADVVKEKLSTSEQTILKKLEEMEVEGMIINARQLIEDEIKILHPSTGLKPNPKIYSHLGEEIVTNICKKVVKNYLNHTTINK